MVPASPTPSQKNATQFNTLPRGFSMSQRPLPDTPKTPNSPSEPDSRSTTPRSSVFDNIQRAPSVTLEKIKSKASATLDRMAQLQAKYRQQKAEQERSRNGSISNEQVIHFKSLTIIVSINNCCQFFMLSLSLSL